MQKVATGNQIIFYLSFSQQKAKNVVVYCHSVQVGFESGISRKKIHFPGWEVI
jgi:hypothetical protein